MNKKTLFEVIMLLAGLFSATQEGYAQWNQQTACPGWNNPANFTAGNAQNKYTGRLGDVSDGDQHNSQYNYITWTSTIYSAAQLAGLTTSSSCDNTGIPSNSNSFVILDTMSQATGASASQRNKDPNTGYRLPFVPNRKFDTYDTTGRIYNTRLTKSIRIGDDCTPGSSTNSAATCLYYQMFPTSQNAMLFIYYAVVVQNPGHGTECDPLFRITVENQHEDGSWHTVSDTLDYLVTSTPAQGQGTTVESGNHYGSVVFQPSFDSNGWHSASTGYSGVNYKDWVKVALNLGNMLYTPVRVAINIGDCCYHAHWAYAYVCGECRELDIKTSGCAAGRDTTVAILSAPRGMLNYEWGASRFGVSDPTTALNPGGANSHFSFRPLDSGTEAGGHADYNVTASDFRVFYRSLPNHDSVRIVDALNRPTDSIGNRQTFRCRMTSALDPNKPFQTNLYVNVQNTKPTMGIDTLSLCNGDVVLRNRSFVPGDNSGLFVDSVTRWAFYSNPNGAGLPDTIMIGDTAVNHYDDTELKSVVVRSYTSDSTCWSEDVYRFRPRKNPDTKMAISKYVLCDADETTIRDITDNSVYRQWTFLKETSSINDSVPEYDTLIGRSDNNNIVTRPFTHSIEPITLTARNGLYYLNPENISDTVWCMATAYDTVAVFVHPELKVTGDTIVCQGSSTDAYVSAVGVDGCTYEWSTVYGIISGSIPSGSHLAVVPYADTAVYYVRVTSPQGCVAWDSIYAYMVRPQLTINPSDGRICPGKIATLTASAAHHYTWTASPNDPSLAGQDTAAVIRVSPTQTTVYTMVGHGSNDCDASPLSKTVTIVPLPEPSIITSPDFVDSDDPTVTLRDVSRNGVSSSWLFNDGERVNAREVTHTFEEATGADSVYVLLTSYNELNCPADKSFGIPVNLFTAWIPNIFNPGTEDENSVFRIYTINEFENFHIYIYNRQGNLVFESDDPHFEWDGTYANGEKCPQGAYVYVCNYRKPGTPTLISKHGAVTLVR